MSVSFTVWFLLVILFFPIAMLILGEIILHLRLESSKLVRPLECVRNLVLPSFTLYLIVAKIIALEKGSIPVRLTETLMWIATIYALLTFLNLFLFEAAREDTWRAKVPTILLDTSRFFLILVGSAIVLSDIWGADLGGLLTALGVGSLVIGLALQDSLGNVFSGVTLLFERPFKLGEWIETESTLGKVTEITWRSVHLVTIAGDLVVVPNSELAKGSIRNKSRPTPICNIPLELRFSRNDAPNRVKSVLTAAALATEGVLPDPAPFIGTSEYGDFSITYEIALSIADFSQESVIRERFLTRIWYAIQRGGLTMPYPISEAIEHQPSAITAENRLAIAQQVLQGVQSLGHLEDDLLDRLSERGIWLEYAQEEIVIHEGEVLPGMYLVIRGQAELSVQGRTGDRQMIARVDSGEFFGEKASLLSESISDVTVRAIEDLTLLLLDTEMIRFLLEHSSRLASELGEIMELRRLALRALRG
jgi:small-conductance mechanosensitive channel